MANQIRPVIAFVFRPGGNAGANVYTKWDKLMEALDSVEGLKILEFDDRKKPCIVPPGTWNMRDVTWTGYAPRDEAFFAEVRIREGAILPELRLITGQLIVTCEADTTPPVSDFDPGGGGTVVQIGIRLDDGVPVIRCLGGAPLFDFGANGVIIRNNGEWNPVALLPGANPPGRVAVGGQVTFHQLPQGVIGPNALDAPAGSTVFIDFLGGAPIGNVQSTILGTLTYRNPRFRSRFRAMPQSVGGAAPVPATAPIDGVQTADCLLFNTTASDIAQTLPSIAASFQSGTVGPALTMGHLLIVKNAKGNKIVKISPSPGDLIDRGTGPIKIGRGQACIFYSDGVSNWYIIAGFQGGDI